jgi:hypothetical protein
LSGWEWRFQKQPKREAKEPMRLTQSDQVLERTQSRAESVLRAAPMMTLATIWASKRL